jgi:transposase InsO family protein
MTHVLTDNGSCFTQAFAKVCAELGADYRHIKPRTPQTNGMVERFNGRIVAEVLAITVYSHAQLAQLLRGFNAAYNARRQRVLEGQTPDQVRRGLCALRHRRSSRSVRSHRSRPIGSASASGQTVRPPTWRT